MIYEDDAPQELTMPEASLAQSIESLETLSGEGWSPEEYAEYDMMWD
jgi:hypothetical protein